MVESIETYYLRVLLQQKFNDLSNVARKEVNNKITGIGLLFV